ncbi:MAG: hypothetical protein H0V67_06795 [Geodermatophilaceae bacterium]|nr:hypothetical protein [Geodermatophilaceae bacterium]
MRPGPAALQHSLRVGGLAPVLLACLLCTAGVASLAGRADVSTLLLVRVSLMVMAASVAGTIGDTIAVLSDACPVGRPRQWLLRLMPALAVLALSWGCFVVAVGAAQPAAAGTVPWGGLTVELTAYTAVGLAAAAGRGRNHPDDSLLAGVAAVAALALLSVLPLLPQRWTLISYPGSPDWAAVHWRWAALAAGAGLLAAWCFRDPATPTRLQPAGRR